jgi:hypothetical protein
MLMAADLLLQSGRFGLAILDFAYVPPKEARKIPLTTWFGLRRSVENTLTVLVASSEMPNAGSSASITIRLGHALTGSLTLDVLDRTGDLFHVGTRKLLTINWLGDGKIGKIGQIAPFDTKFWAVRCVVAGQFIKVADPHHPNNRPCV